MKKLFTTFLALGFVAASLTGCGNKGKSKNSNEIKRVEISGVVDPSYRITPRELNANLSAESEQYKLIEANWSFKDKTGSHEDHIIGLDDYLTYEYAYTLEVVLRRKGKYLFSENTRVLVNSENQDDDSEMIVSEDGTGFTFRTHWEALDPTIYDLAITNVTAPVVGEQSLFSNILADHTDKCEINGSNTSTFWEDGNYKFTGVFEAGHTYTIRVILNPKVYYTHDEDNHETKYFPFASDIVVTVNGQPATEVIAAGSGGRSISVRYTFPQL